MPDTISSATRCETPSGLNPECSIEKCAIPKGIINGTSKEILGLKIRTHQDWFENGEKIKAAAHAKNMAYTEWQNKPSNISKRNRFKSFQAKVQIGLRSMQDNWWQDKADEVHYFAETHKLKKFFSTL